VVGAVEDEVVLGEDVDGGLGGEVVSVAVVGGIGIEAVCGVLSSTQ